MKVLLITGSYPPDVCGVADYTARLAEALDRKGLKVAVFTGKEWNAANALSLSREIDASQPDMLHIQYPATGYGWGVGPQVLSILKPMVVTIHECSQSHMLRRISLYPFSARAHAVVFTTEYERRYAVRFAPWISSRATVIPIGTNISPGPSTIPRLSNVITYFGLIRTHKGIEQVIELSRLCLERSNGLFVRIVGALMPGNEWFYEQVRQSASELPIEWILGREGPELSLTLAEGEIGYLPFPDGASERRGSLLAMLSNRVAVITSRGAQTPPSLTNAVEFASSPSEAVLFAEQLSVNHQKRQATQARAGEYAAAFDWDVIAERHLELYRGIATRS